MLSGNQQLNRWPGWAREYQELSGWPGRNSTLSVHRSYFQRVGSHSAVMHITVTNKGQRAERVSKPGIRIPKPCTDHAYCGGLFPSAAQ